MLACASDRRRYRRSLHALQAAQLFGELLVTLSGHVHFLAQRASSGRRSPVKWCDARKPLSTRGRRFDAPRAARLRLPRRGDSIVSTRPSRICVALAATLAARPVLPGRLRRRRRRMAGPGGSERPGAPLRRRGPRVRARPDRHRGRVGDRARRDHAPGPEPGSLADPRRSRPARGLARRTRCASLREKVGGFDYQIYPEVLYVRSNLLVDQKTSLDAPLLEGGRVRGRPRRARAR